MNARVLAATLGLARDEGAFDNAYRVEGEGLKIEKWTTIAGGVAVAILAVVSSAQAGSMGSLEAWGSNSYGACDVPGGTDFAAISAGAGHSLGLKGNGSLVGFGHGWYGLDDDIPSGNEFTAIASGYYHNLALKADGSIVAWGWNANGECEVPSRNDYTAVSAGYLHSLALTADGALVAWGANNYGQCNIPGGTGFAAIASGSYHNLALKSDGTIIAWGYNVWNVCDVPGDDGFVAISAGIHHGVALRQDGSLAAWGKNLDHECDVPPGNDFVTISAGLSHTLALKADGSVVGWGKNDYGQCSVPSGSGYLAVAGGYSHSLAIIPGPAALEVAVDIKPGSWPNPLNPVSKGVLPMAVCGTDEFDVMTIDTETLLLGREGIDGVAPLRWSYEDVAAPFEGEWSDGHGRYGDGFMDLALKFRTQELVTALGLDLLTGQAVPLVLTGSLLDGTALTGSDFVWVLSPGDGNMDGLVDGLDYIGWSNHYGTGTAWSDGEFTGDGVVDGLDYIVWSSNYDVGCPAAVPEPSCAVLLALGLLALRRRFGA